jgi:hypothetical protein
MRVGAEFGSCSASPAGTPTPSASCGASAVQPDHVQALWWLGINLIDLGRAPTDRAARARPPR